MLHSSKAIRPHWAIFTESFRWAGEYSYDLTARETLDTRLGVLADSNPPSPAPASARAAAETSSSVP